ncbi:MAG: hypothetical protein HY578_10485 [Nitrospinae bacterium]|nr:hypothetical protein [Nitrospinota bacterium]
MESVYENAIVLELRKEGLKVEQQREVTVVNYDIKDKEILRPLFDLI